MVYRIEYAHKGKTWVVEREGSQIIAVRHAQEPYAKATNAERAAVIDALALRAFMSLEKRERATSRHHTRSWIAVLGDGGPAESPYVEFDPVDGDAKNGWRCRSCSEIVPGPKHKAAFEHASNGKCAKPPSHGV